jgi:glycine cleavage system H protein
MPKYLEMTADKFTFRVATDRLYSPEGAWVLPEPDSKRVRVGLADYLQQHNGDVAFANVKPVGSKLAAGDQFAEIETIKAMVDLHAPVSGTIVEVNAALNISPEAINQAPYEAGWLAVIEPSAWGAERPKLLGPAAYFAVMQGQVQEDLKGL